MLPEMGGGGVLVKSLKKKKKTQTEKKRKQAWLPSHFGNCPAVMWILFLPVMAGGIFFCGGGGLGSKPLTADNPLSRPPLPLRRVTGLPKPILFFYAN